jgi:hypothetical protein
MKRATILILAMILGVTVAGQHRFNDDSGQENHARQRQAGRECDTRVERADSVVVFAYNAVTDSFTPTEVFHYSYDSRDNLTVINRMTLPERSDIIRQVFEYDGYGNQIKYTNFLPSGNGWEMSLFVTKNYDAGNRLLNEVFHNRDSAGNFTPYMRHFYSYEGSMISGYLRQMKNASREWYDFSNHYYVYDSMGRLTVLYGQYINGPVYWERTSVYDNDEMMLSQRYLRQLKYDPVLRQNVLTNITFEDYSRNIFGNVSEILYHSWTNGNWELSGKAVYYYSFLKNKKVSICHNGLTLCVSVNAVEAHLRHGDKLGPCTGEEQVKPGFDIFPNPASGNITIRFSEEGLNYTGGVIVSHDGRVLRRFSYSDENQLSMNISQLRNGTYFLLMYRSDGGTDTQSLIKK